jgi:hypothetical protein
LQQSSQSSTSSSFNGSFQSNQSSTSAAASKSKTTTTTIQQQDLVAAADIVADYLSPASRDLLWAALGLTTVAMEGSSLTQQQLGGAEKRKKDWEMELEVSE